MDTSPGNNLDPWYSHYAERTAGLTVSEVRALFAVASRPEVVSLAGGMPFVSALPQQLLLTAVDRTIRDHGAVALQYGSGQGLPRLREQILEVMALEGIRAGVDDVVVTTGSQHALELVSKLFLDPGDVVIAEGPSYVTALVVFRSFQADVAHVEMDEFGLIPQSLRDTIARLRGEGRRIKFLYTIPSFQNPMGVTLSWERRMEVLEIARENDI
ncbi:MAG: PLP-dependent aminotransferase family protein, partial [Pseudolysinimonas sp.]